MDPTIPITITEGEKKALKGSQEGVNCIGLSGLWNWSDGKQELIKDFDLINLNGRKVFLVPDNDWLSPNKHGYEKNLKQAVYGLANQLMKRGARVFIVSLPVDNGGEKIGLDDYLITHSVDDFKSLPLVEVKPLEEQIKNASESNYQSVVAELATLTDSVQRELLMKELARKLKVPYRTIQHEVKTHQARGESAGALENAETDPYFLDDASNLYMRKKTRDGSVNVRLANFDALITRELIHDNGVDVTHAYRIEGRTGEGSLSAIEVPASSFANLGWLHRWGTKAIVEPGQTIKDYVRHAIQVRSGTPERTTHYSHTGWRQIDGNWGYLTFGGAIGIENVLVDLPPELQRYHLPLSPENEKEAILASLSFLDIGKREVILPLYVFTFLAPLTTVLPIMPNFSAYVYGPTGTLKSTLAVLLLGHFGDFGSIERLSNFDDTANSLEKRAFILKDTILVLDDYHPSARRGDHEQKEHLAQRMIRSFANRTGRGRLNSDTTDKGRYEPRGMLIITGEELVSLQSTLARIMVVELTPGDVDKVKLTELQSKAHLLPDAMSSYIGWVKDHLQEIIETFRCRFVELRNLASGLGIHSKLPEQIAFLQFAWDTALSWMVDRGVLMPTDAISRSEEGYAIFVQHAKHQGYRIEREDPVERFLDVLKTLITQGRVRINPKDILGDHLGGKDADLIGYYDQIYFYLLPSALWHSISRYFILEGYHFPVHKNTIYRMLANKGHIVTRGGRHTVPERIQGQVTKVLKVFRSSIAENEVTEVTDEE